MVHRLSVFDKFYEIANAGFSCHQLPVAPLPVDVPPPNDEELSKDGDGPV